MKLLAVETSSIACSVALEVEGRVIERHAEQAREHTRLVVPMISEILAEAGLTAGELDALVLGNGPGSFIGLRIAASVVQGIAFASSLQVIPVSSLLAVATEAFTDTDVDEVIVTADAHMNEVYFGRFGREADGRVVMLDKERLEAIAELDCLGRDGRSRLAAGAGWHRYPELYAMNRERFVALSKAVFPRARFLLPESARLYLSDDLIGPASIEPTYLRKQVATPKATS